MTQTNRTRIGGFFIGVGFLVLPIAALAQNIVTTPYQCGSVYSSVPCDYSNGYQVPIGYSVPYQVAYPVAYAPYNAYVASPYYGYGNYYASAYPSPTCSISVSPQNYYGNQYYNGDPYTFINQPATLTWSSSYVTSAYIKPNGGSVAPSGSMTVYPNGNYNYTMTVSGPGGGTTCSTQLNNYGYYQGQYYNQGSYYSQGSYGGWGGSHGRSGSRTNRWHK